LLEAVGKDVSCTAADHPRRNELWENLNPAEINVLLPLVANILIDRINAGITTTQPEPLLSTKIMEISRISKPSSRMVCTLLSWNIPHLEDETIGWFYNFTRADWQIAATQIGQAVLARNWRNAAKNLHDLSGSIPESRPAVELCKELLSRWDRFKLMLSAPSPRNHHYQDLTELINHIADIGSELSPDGLDEIWERAGGKRRDLESKGTARMRWQNATRFAANGAKCSLADLIRELQRDFPMNIQLNDVEEVLRRLK
jgi:hypothetical protein